VIDETKLPKGAKVLRLAEAEHNLKLVDEIIETGTHGFSGNTFVEGEPTIDWIVISFFAQLKTLHYKIRRQNHFKLIILHQNNENRLAKRSQWIPTPRGMAAVRTRNAWAI